VEVLLAKPEPALPLPAEVGTVASSAYVPFEAVAMIVVYFMWCILCGIGRVFSLSGLMI